MDWGSRRNPRVVICAHGYSGNGRDFDFLARELSRDARVVCPDMAGRGRSAWLPSSIAYNFPQFFSDIRALIAARRLPDGYALHYDPRIASFMQPTPFAPGLSLWSAWHRVRCPVLLVRGRTSRIFPVEVAETMLQVKPNAEYAQITDAGHAPSLMAPGQIAIVGEFLARGMTERMQRAA